MSQPVSLALEARLYPIDDVRPHPRNPRKGNLNAVIESIKENGLYRAIVVQKSTGYILAGNHTWRAAKHLGYEELMMVMVDVDDDRARNILLADNATADLGGYDNRLLAELLSETNAGGGLEGTGYNEEALDALLAELAVQEKKAKKKIEDVEPKIALAEQLQEKWKVAQGDLYVAGSHRILCGDSLDPASYGRVLGRKKIDLLATDPPYGVNLGSHKDIFESRSRHRRTDGLKISNDELTGDNFRKFLDDWFAAVVPSLAPGGVFYICHADSIGHVFRQATLDAGLHLSTNIVWVKDLFVLVRQGYHWRHEPILYGWKKGKAHHWCGDRTQDTVWEIPRPRQSKEHPTMKPVALMEKMIANSLRPGGTVCDPFAGSGTTILAAEKLAAKCAAIEYDPKFVAVILERLTDAGIKPKKEK